MRQQRISRCATGLMALVAVFGLIWTAEYTLRLSQVLFFTDWSEWRVVDDAVTVTPGMRAMLSLYYVPVFAAAWFCIWAALRLLNSLRRGDLFTKDPARYMVWLGLGLILVSAVDTYVPAFELSLYTMWNADGPVAPRYFYDAGDITIALAGLGFALIGLLWREAVLMAEENEGIV